MKLQKCPSLNRHNAVFHVLLNYNLLENWIYEVYYRPVCALFENVKILVIDVKLTMLFEIIRNGHSVWAYIWRSGISAIL